MEPGGAGLGLTTMASASVDATATLEARVRATLDGIVDPCSAAAGAPAGLVEMGLVRAVEVRPGPAGASVRVSIGLTEPGCLMGIPFTRTARERLTALPGVASVRVDLDPDVEWTPRRLAPAYAERLEAVRSRRPDRTTAPPRPRRAPG